MGKINLLNSRFGKEKRGGNKGNSGPGPGSYHIPCSMVDVPKYLFGGTGFDPNYRYI